LLLTQADQLINSLSGTLTLKDEAIADLRQEIEQMRRENERLDSAYRAQSACTMRSLQHYITASEAADSVRSGLMRQLGALRDNVSGLTPDQATEIVRNHEANLTTTRRQMEADIATIEEGAWRLGLEERLGMGWPAAEPEPAESAVGPSGLIPLKHGWLHPDADGRVMDEFSADAQPARNFLGSEESSEEDWFSVSWPLAGAVQACRSNLTCWLGQGSDAGAGESPVPRHLYQPARLKTDANPTPGRQAYLARRAAEAAQPGQTEPDGARISNAPDAAGDGGAPPSSTTTQVSPSDVILVDSADGLMLGWVSHTDVSHMARC